MDEEFFDVPGLLRYLDSKRESRTLNLSYRLPALPDFDQAVKEVTDYVKDNPFVTCLDLRGNKIEAAGAMLIAKALKVNKSIQSLHLKWNAIGRDTSGLQSMCLALKANLSITQLDLRNNRINSQGAKMIAEMLEENTALTHVDLAFNQLEVAGGVALLGAIKNNKTLVDVQLGGSKVGEEVVHEVAYLLRLNRKRREANAIAPDLPAAIVKFHEATQKFVEEETERRKREGDDRPIVLEYPKDPFTPQEGNSIMLRLMMKEREEVLPEEKAVYHHVTEYIEKLLRDTTVHQTMRVEAEEREHIDTLGFQEREERYIREVKQIEDALMDALAEKDRLTKVLDYKKKEKKWADDELADAASQTVQAEVSCKTLEQELRVEIKRLREENVLLEGKLALAKKDEDLLVAEVEDLRVHAKNFQKDINLILGSD